jgi:membrane protein
VRKLPVFVPEPSAPSTRRAMAARRVRCSVDECTSQAMRLAGFARHAVNRFIADRCLTGASALSYATIVSLVPLTAVVLAIFSGFPIFGDARERFLGILLDNFVPEVGQEAAVWFKHVATNAAQTTVVGGIALVVTSILLLATIEKELHVIWRVTAPRPWPQRVLAYWTVLTLGPILLGVGLSLSGYLNSIAHAIGVDAELFERASGAWIAGFSGLVPFVIEAAAFTLLYCLIPNCAALLEGLKLAFALFVSRLSSYNAVYGALAGIPIVLSWMYIFWGVVLFGAEIAARAPMPLRPAHPRVGGGLSMSNDAVMSAPATDDRPGVVGREMAGGAEARR